jgi:type IV pilus assembly protein PilA
MTKKLNNKGFSLVELIIVIAIMAVLVGVLAPQFIKYVESSRQSTDIDAVAEYKTAVETYVADEGSKAGATIAAEYKIVTTTTGVYAKDVDLSDIGLSAGSNATETKFKSSGWSAGDLATYNTSTYAWTASSNQNSKKPEKNLRDAFE